MTTTTTNTYESLFLLPQSAGSDLGVAAELVKSLLEKVGAEIIAFRKWDERRLAYEIKGNKRGLYFLCYFHLAGAQVAALDRQCLLAEGILRHMVTRADHLTLEQMQTADAQQELADEIKLRAEQAKDKTSTATAIIDREDTTKTEDSAAPANAEEMPSDDEEVVTEAVPAESTPGGESA
ncbi:MAG: 30S ribosomal protein S6 [Planctomycetota bacterium]|nr:30S ribosomal protein S6 [Planctomycetota bacterium]